MEVWISDKDKVSVQFFTKKLQFKVFVTINDRMNAIKFFEKVFKMKEIPILDSHDLTVELFKREMRVYLVKSEAEF